MSKKKMWKKLKMLFIILGWITGVIASTIIMQQNNVDTEISIRNIFYLIIISVSGFSFLYEKIDDILDAPIWMNFSMGILTGIIGRLLSLYLTNPWVIFELIKNLT